MRWIVPALFLAGALSFGCGGPQVPTHNGYKSAKSRPWKKPKTIKLDDDLEGRIDGDLSYRDKRRARWHAVVLPSHGELELRLEVLPPGDAVNDDFDLAMEVLDPGFRVISKSDLEEEDAGELTKSKKLVDLSPGKYLIHLYLQGRMDIADYELRVAFKPTGGGEVASNFPAEVDFVPALAMVPLNDDTPKSYRPQKPVVGRTGRRPKVRIKKADPEAPPPTTVSARIIGLKVEGGGTILTLGRGTASTPPAMNGMKAKVSGVPGLASVSNCGDRTCKVTVQATPDQITKAGGSVVLSP